MYSFVNVLVKNLYKFGQSSSVVKGNELLIFIQGLIAAGNRISRFNSSERIVEYKFYSILLAELISFQKSHGSNIQKQLLALRNSLACDIQFEEEVHNLIKAQLFQLIAGDISIITLSFMAQRLLSFSSSFLNFLLIFWQILGIILCLVLAKKVTQRNTKAVYISFKFLSKIEIYSGVLVSSTTLIKNLNLTDLDFLKNLNDYRFLATGLEQLVSAWIKEGSNPAPSLPLYYAEWDFRQKQSLLKLKNQLSLMGFLLLISFNLIPYLFLVLFLLFSKFQA